MDLRSLDYSTDTREPMQLFNSFYRLWIMIKSSCHPYNVLYNNSLDKFQDLFNPQFIRDSLLNNFEYHLKGKINMFAYNNQSHRYIKHNLNCLKSHKKPLYKLKKYFVAYIWEMRIFNFGDYCIWLKRCNVNMLESK